MIKNKNKKNSPKEMKYLCEHFVYSHVNLIMVPEEKVEVSPNSAGFIHWEPLMSSSNC